MGATDTPVDQPRRRDAAATRRSLLSAARVLMAQHGVEGTSTRDVAAAAGVNQTLVYRYFGSKEKLFAEAAGVGTRDPGALVDGTPLTDLPRVLLNTALDASAAVEDGGGDFSMFIAAANDDTVRGIFRERIESAFGARLAARLAGPDAALRAELLAALLVGISVLRGKVGTPAITNAHRDTLGAYVDRMAEPLLAAKPEAPQEGATGADRPRAAEMA
jgi:AcrR family transcriptional regulator